MTKTNIYQRKDGRWEARISLGKDKDGKRLYRSCYGKTRDEADGKASVARFALLPAVENAVTEMTVRELAEEYITVKRTQLKISTLANYTMKLQKHIIPCFGECQCVSFNVKQASTFISEKLVSGLSERYVCDLIVLLKSLFKYASAVYNIPNRLEGLVMPKCRKPEIKILDDKEQRKLIDYINDNLSQKNMGIIIPLYIGIRIGELCALQWKDVDLEKRILTVRKTIQRVQCYDGKKRTEVVIIDPKSESSKREIPIPKELVRLLEKFKSDNDVFVASGSKKPVEPRTMQYRFAKILHNANLPSVSFHSLRHAFSTRCIEMGFDVKTLSEILGHSSVEVTLNRYVHSSIDRKRSFMDKLTFAA